MVLRKKINGSPGISEVALTRLLDQLRRDVQATVERESEAIRRDTRNALTAYALDETDRRKARR